MDNKIDLPKLQTEIIAYLNKKKAYEFGYIKYSQIKKTIMFITTIKKSYIIRKIFLSLVEQDIFIKKQNKNVRSYLYKFRNPNEARTEKKNIIITFE